MTSLISYPMQSIYGDIVVPGDKSISHRAIMLGSIAEGITEISNFLDGKDCMATLVAFRCMGVVIEGPDNGKVIIHGVGRNGLNPPSKPIDCGNSGTSMRLMAGLLAAQPFDSRLVGDESLHKRPMQRIIDPLTQMGAQITSKAGLPPLTIQASTRLSAIKYVMTTASAQLKSCILLAGLYAQGKTTIIQNGISRDHTERMLEAFDYPISYNKYGVAIEGGGVCRGISIEIPGDLSSAAFFIVAATIIPGSDLMIRRVGINPSRQGILDILRLMGADIVLLNQSMTGKEPICDLHIKYSPLRAITIPESLVPLSIDEFPVLFIAAACAKGTTVLHGAEELRVKETDRIAVMAEGLEALGIEVEVFDDGIAIHGGSFNGGVVNSDRDHRIAMSFAVAGALAKAPVIIHDAEHIATSFPSFVRIANAVGLNLEESEFHDSK